MASDEIEKHLLVCFSKTRLTYNSKRVGVKVQEGMVLATATFYILCSSSVLPAHFE